MELAMCKNGIIIVVHQIQGHRIYSESIGWAIETRRLAPRAQARVVTEIWFLYSTAYSTHTLPVPLRPGHLKYTNQHSLGGKDHHSLLYHDKPSAIRTIWPDRKETARRPQNLHEPRPE